MAVASSVARCWSFECTCVPRNMTVENAQGVMVQC